MAQVKPPLGIDPKRFWVQKRIHELQKAIRRYRHAKMPVSPEWIKELNEHKEATFEN